MNKVIIVLGVTLGILSGAAAGYFVAMRKKPVMVGGQRLPQKKIAIVLPVSHPSLEQISAGFKDELQKDKQHTYVFVEYNGNGNKSLLRSQIEDIVSQDYDLLFTIATLPSLMAKEVTLKKNKELPIVFGAAMPDDLVASLESSGNNVTGVIDKIPVDQQLDVLKFLKPTAESILLVYSSASPSLEQEVKHAEQCAKERGFKFMRVSIERSSEIAQKVPAYLTSVDTVLVLKDNTVVSGLDALIKLCGRHGVTLYASDLDSVDRGAALGFGVHEYDMGLEAAKKAYSILIAGKKPTDIPSSMATDCKVKVNTSSMGAQGLPLDKNTLFLMSSGEVVS